MDLNELENAFTRLKEHLQERDTTRKWGITSMQTSGLEPELLGEFDTPEAAWNALVQAAPKAGWIQWQSHQTSFQEGKLPQPEPGWGVLLAAEAAVTGTDSLRLDYLDDRWRLTRYRHIEEGSKYLCDETHHLLHGESNRRLRYRRYWQIDNEQGAMQICAVLIGID